MGCVLPLCLAVYRSNARDLAHSGRVRGISTRNGAIHSLSYDRLVLQAAFFLLFLSGNWKITAATEQSHERAGGARGEILPIAENGTALEEGTPDTPPNPRYG